MSHIFQQDIKLAGLNLMDNMILLDNHWNNSMMIRNFLNHIFQLDMDTFFLQYNKIQEDMEFDYFE